MRGQSGSVGNPRSTPGLNSPALITTSTSTSTIFMCPKLKWNKTRTRKILPGKRFKSTSILKTKMFYDELEQGAAARVATVASELLLRFVCLYLCEAFLLLMPALDAAQFN